MTQCKNNPYVKNTFDIIFQVTLIAIFLTVFFFTYVSNVEKEEFKKQLDLIVDDLLSDQDIRSIIPQNLSQTQKDNLAIVISGSLEAAKTKSTINQQNAINDVINNNSKVKSSTYKKIFYVLIIIIILCIIVLLLGYCLPVMYQIKEATIVVFFVALTELMFLEIIAKNYISANPNKIKAEVAQAIKEWLKDNPNGLN
jgi:hypothetical protein